MDGMMVVGYLIDVDWMGYTNDVLVVVVLVVVRVGYKEKTRGEDERFLV